MDNIANGQPQPSTALFPLPFGAHFPHLRFPLLPALFPLLRPPLPTLPLLRPALHPLLLPFLLPKIASLQNAAATGQNVHDKRPKRTKLSIDAIIGHNTENATNNNREASEEEAASSSSNVCCTAPMLRLCTKEGEDEKRMSVIFDGPGHSAQVGSRIEISSHLRRLCARLTAFDGQANLCAKTGTVLRQIVRGDEIVLLEARQTEKPPKKAKGQHRVCFGLTAEERAQIHAMETSGEGAQGFGCPRCGKVFSYAYYRDKHLKYTRCVDNGNRRFPCSLCARSFEKRDRLRIHVLHVHERHRPHKCPLCPKAFSQSSSLNKHLRTHSGERPYKCPNCEKAFTASSILRTHIRQHSGEKPFKCVICGKSFASHAAHDSHLRRTHQHQ